MAARHNSAAYDDYDSGTSYVLQELMPGERIGTPPRRRRGRALRRISLLLLVAGGAAWALQSDTTAWQEWLSEQMTAASAALDRMRTAWTPATAPAASTTPLVRAETVKLPAIDGPPISPRPLPASAAEAPAAPVTTAALPPASKDADEPAANEPLPPPTVDPSDPYQKRALAAGLHPGLSRVLLAKLSAADYQNASVAIKTALAETPDSGVYVWPRQRKPELALFKVRFVAGAASGCRRYVVTVTKDGWLTTALPMEKCGAEAMRSRPS